MAITNVANDQQQIRAFAVTEASPGAGGTPTFVLLGQMTIQEARALADIASFAGTYAKDYVPVYGPTDISGSYTQPLTYEALAMLPRYALATAPTPVSDANTVPGYTYTYNHDMAAATRQTMAMLYGFQEMPFLVKGVRFPSFNIACDVDDAQAAWTLNVPDVFASSKELYMRSAGTATAATSTVVTDTTKAYTVNQYANGWLHLTGGTGIDQARKIVSNTATAITVTPAFTVTPTAGTKFVATGPMPSIAVPSYVSINSENTQVFLDDYVGGTIGTTNDSNRVISWNVGFNWPTQPKRFLGSGSGYDAKSGNGAISVTGSIRMEFDSPKEYERFINRGLLKIRFKQTDTTLINTSPATYRTAQIDVFRAALEAPAYDFRNSNQTQTINFRGYVDPTEGVAERITVKTATAALP